MSIENEQSDEQWNTEAEYPASFAEAGLLYAAINRIVKVFKKRSHRSTSHERSDSVPDS